MFCQCGIGFIVGIVLLLTPNVLTAELRIEVTHGVDNAVPIAVVPFAWSGRGLLPENVTEVISSDLQMSGRFASLPATQMLSNPTTREQVFFRDWRMLKTEYLLIGSVRPTGERLTLHFELYDVFKQSLLISREITGSLDELRDMAHYVSDVVYEKLTGIAGAFSTRILYVTATGTPENRLFALNVADADGQRAEVIMESREPLLSAVWSPDGSSVAYVSFEREGRPAIFIRDLVRGTREQITAFPGLNGAPSWSPDGKSMAMVLSRDGNPEIYVMDIATRGMRRITRHYGIDTEPSWTPDGAGLIFTSNRGGKPQIYKVNLGNLELERLTFEGDYNARARLLPDGRSMVFVHRRNGTFHIALLELQRGRLTVLTETALDESPSIAPNGSMLVYATQYQGRGILAAVSIDGGVKFRLPSSEGDVREPAWSPHKRKVFTPLILE